MGHLEYIGEPNRDHMAEGLKSKMGSSAEHMFGIKNLAKPLMLFAGANLLKYA
jgi:hypothetical protein